MPRKVFVSGCYDLLHSGHVAFFQQAAKYGDVYVALGSDRTVFELKGRPPVNSEQERLFMVKSVSCVTDPLISRGSGLLDFAGEVAAIRPDVFIVNEDGNIPAKRELCQTLDIEYVVLHRVPEAGLTARSTTDEETLDTIRAVAAAHMLGAHAEVTRNLLGIPAQRVRDAGLVPELKRVVPNGLGWVISSEPGEATLSVSKHRIPQAMPARSALYMSLGSLSMSPCSIANHLPNGEVFCPGQPTVV